MHMTNRIARRDALAAIGATGVGALGASAGCLSRLTGANVDLPTTATAQFRGGLERRGVYPSATVPDTVERAWARRDLNTGEHTAAKASPVPVGDGTSDAGGVGDGSDLLVPGDAGVLWRVTPDGERVWETTVTSASRGIHGTPAVAGELAFVGAYDGVLSAYDVATGDAVWRTDLGDAIGSSPAYHDDVVYIAVEYNDPSGAMFGVDATNGDVVWEDQRITDHPHSTCAIDRDAGRLVVGSNDGFLYAWTYPGLEFEWRFETGNAIKGPVAIADGSAFFGSWDAHVYRVALADGSEEWATATNDLVMSGPSVEPETGTVYVGSHDHNLYALEIDSGDVRWRYDAGSGENRIVGCPTVTSEHVLAGSYDQTLHAVSKADGERVWTAAGVGRVTSTPRVVDGAVYFADRASEAYIEDGTGKSGALYRLDGDA